MPAKSAKQLRLMQMASSDKRPSNFIGPSKEVAEKFIRETPKSKRSLFAKKNSK